MRGFIALTSVLIISAVILLLVVGASIPVFYARMDMLESEWKLQSQLWAKSCVEVTVLHLVADPAYVGGDTVAVGDTSCTVSTFTHAGDHQQFAVKINYHA
ncbi:MAG TPA: hypothetical protein VHB93_01235, partial [Candidatus Paceibacterota bacterium]|nr:hypothetical protein [Candidatus Paceibacterota bacterium]